ncbi:NF038104 family lipoprotein [Moraxella oblonga]|uniref:NF038104 family lipoprotein n=1 Tax=Moraxella oblonga TaxID=200413 RepID=UPI0008309FB8|nr:NF038104 family lipoprotein [Moraxella oblonga]
MKKSLCLFMLTLSALLLQGCIHKVVTTPVKVAYKTTKGVVKGTAKAINALTDDDEEENNKKKKDKD